MKIDLPTESPTPKRDSLSIGKRFLIDAVILLIALASLPLGLTFEEWHPEGWKDGLVILGVLLVMAIPTVGITTVILRLSSLSRAILPIQTIRLAARGGILIVVLAGGIFVLISVLQSRGLATESALSSHPYTLWLTVALSFIPVVAFSSFLGLVFSLLLRPRSENPTTVIRAPVDEGKSRRRKPGVIYVSALVGAVLCLASPFALPWWPAPAPPPVAGAPAPPERFEGDLTEAPEPSTSKPDQEPFSYQEPLGFDTAPSSQWRVLSQKIIPDVNHRYPVMMSPNGQFLAFTSLTHSDALIVFDLNRFAVHSHYPGMEALRELAWSPESDLLFCLTQQERPFAFVIRLERLERLALPLRQEASLPIGQPYWWEDFEIAFFPESGSALYLDLATLRIRPIVQSHRWRRLEEQSPSGQVSRPSLKLPESSHIRFAAAPRIASYRVPGYQQQNWEFSSETTLAIQDKKGSAILANAACPLAPGDRIAAAGRSMKLVRLRDGEALVTYYTLDDPAPSFLEGILPEGIDPRTDDEFAKQLREKQVCAFVCAPRTNPITGQVVGPDRERVKALVRWISDTQGTARFWIAERYASIDEGDVLADLHLWKDGQPLSSSHPFREHWWTTVVPLPAEKEVALPSMPPLDRLSEAHFRSRLGTLQLERIRYPVSTGISAPPTPPETEPIETPTVARSTQTEKPDSSPPVATTPEDRIRVFIRAHYEKLETKDFEGYLDDYTDYIVYYGKAGTRNDHLRPAVLSLRSARSIEATLFDPIRVRKEPGNESDRYTVFYEVALTRTESSGKTSTQRSRVELGVFLIGDTIRIVEESTPEPDEPTR